VSGDRSPAPADVLFVGIGQLATARAPGPHAGARQEAALQVIDGAALAVRGDRVAWVGEARSWHGEARRVVDLGGRVVVPGLVDPHTHLLWAGDRYDDFEARSRGEGYEARHARGGGIHHTMRATLAATRDDLVAMAQPRVAALVRSGATTIEVKSGYGGTLDGELRSLEAIEALARRTPARLVPTLLLHVPPADDRDAFVADVVATLVPETARRGLARRVDVFVERQAFTSAEAAAILASARDHGLDATLHVDQFTVMGGVGVGIAAGVRSLDHLEVSGPAEFAAIAASRVVGTLLPGASLCVGPRHADGRALVDAGAAVAVATDLNPGSSPLASTSLALALSVRLNGLRPAEALVAATVNAAAALGRDDVGRLAPGTLADLLVLPGSDWRMLPFELGASAPLEVWIGGVRVSDGGEA
jgi:imidazolonepropionase